MNGTLTIANPLENLLSSSGAVSSPIVVSSPDLYDESSPRVIGGILSRISSFSSGTLFDRQSKNTDAISNFLTEGADMAGERANELSDIDGLAPVLEVEQPNLEIPQISFAPKARLKITANVTVRRGRLHLNIPAILEED